MRKYRVRFFDGTRTVEEIIEATCLGQAMKTAQAINNDLNANHHYREDYILKAVTVKEVSPADFVEKMRELGL